MKANNFIGVITKILDPDLYTVEVDIPEENVELKAFPLRGEVDEPRIGDVVYLVELDPVYHSYYLYGKLKENSFIGFRSRGKQVKITETDITIGIFDPSAEYNDVKTEDTTPAVTSWIKIDSSGNIDINAEGNETIKIAGDSTIEISGNQTIKISGNQSIEVSGNQDVKVSGNLKVEASGNAEIKSPNIKIEGSQTQITGGQLTTNGTAAPSGSGPFCGIPVCPFSGAPHVGNMVSGT